MRTRLAALLAAAALAPARPALAAAADRSKPPAVGAPKALKLPPVQRMALANGLPVMLVQIHEVPMVEVVVLVRSGAAADLPNRTGLAAMTAEMLDEGAGGRDALAIADALDLLGAELGTDCSWDASSIRLHVPASRLSAALPLLADVVLRPAFKQKDLDRLRREALTSLLQAREEPRALASFALARAVFGEGHRYGLPLGGDAASIAALKPADLRAFHARQYRPDNASVLVVGAVDRTSLLPLLDKGFSAWARGGQPSPPLPDAPQVNGRSVLIVDRPGSAQSAIRVGRVGPGRSTPDYHALQVMNTLLGGSFSSRLNDNLREQHGYTYGASSRFDFRRAVGVFLAAADVQTPSTAEALREFMNELGRIRLLARKEEVERARNYLGYGHAQEFETTRQIAAKLAEQALYGLPDDEFASFVPKVLDVDPKAVQRAATGAIDPANLALVVVGDRTRIEGSIRALELGPLNVLTVDQLMGPAPRVPAPEKPERRGGRSAE